MMKNIFLFVLTFCYVSGHTQVLSFSSENKNTRFIYQYYTSAQDSVLVNINIHNLEEVREAFRRRKNHIKNYFNRLKADALNQSLSAEQVNLLFDTLNNQLIDSLAVYRESKRIYNRFAYEKRTQGAINFFGFVKNQQDALLFFENDLASDKNHFLNNSTINFGPNGNHVSLSTDVYKDYIGVFQVTIGALVSNSSLTNPQEVDTSAVAQDAAQRLIGGGGNASINLYYPFLRADIANVLKLKGFIGPRLGFDVPELGTSSSDFGFNIDYRMQIFGYVSSAKDIIKPYFLIRASRYAGNDDFYAALGTQESFNIGEINIGLELGGSLRLSFSKYWAPEHLEDQFGSSISLSIIPQK